MHIKYVLKKFYPFDFQGGKKITALACGQTSSLALVDNGEVNTKTFELSLDFFSTTNNLELKADEQ